MFQQPGLFESCWNFGGRKLLLPGRVHLLGLRQRFLLATKSLLSLGEGATSWVVVDQHIHASHASQRQDLFGIVDECPSRLERLPLISRYATSSQTRLNAVPMPVDHLQDIRNAFQGMFGRR